MTGSTSWGGFETASRPATLARAIASRTYYRLAGANYDRELFARRNRTPAGSFRCYDPLNRHGGDEMLAELAAHCGPADVVYDVGANVGVYALALVSEAPDRRVVAFEPSPRVVDRLRANLRANPDAVADRIAVRACGIGDETGERPFYVSTLPELSGFDRASATRWGARVADVVPVPIRRLDDPPVGGDTDDLLPPDVLKVDVEGAAPAVIRGARETIDRHEPTLFVEVHEAGFADDVPAETRRAIEDSGYRVLERDGYLRCDPP